MGRASPSECVELTSEVTLYGDSSGSDGAFGILCSPSQEGKCSALILKGGRRWMCALKGCKERRLATFSCLRLGFTVLRIFMEQSYFFSIFIARGASPLVWDHIKLVIVLVGELGFPDSMLVVSHWTCLSWKDDSFHPGDTDFQRIGPVVIMLTRWLQWSSPK